MGEFTIRSGRRYRAMISLGWLERLAGNDVVADKLRDAGFSDVRVSGSGGTRLAEATWPGADVTGQIPSQISEITEI